MLGSQSVLDHGLAPTAAVLAEAFSDYFVALPFSAASLTAMARQDSVDLIGSRVWLLDAVPAGVLLHAERGWSGRLAGMGIVPAARRQGVGNAAVEAWISYARSRGLRTLSLEVIGANTAARALYARFGFQPVQRLAGWNFSPPAITTNAASPAPERVDPRALARLIATRDPDGTLPWQIAAETIAHLSTPWTAWQLGGAAVVVSDLGATTITLRGLSFDPSAGPASAASLLRSLIARYPDRTWRAPALFPESWSAAFTAAGWTLAPLDQWHLHLAL